MYTLKCDCGYDASHENHYMTEAMMWVHGWEHHKEEIGKMTPEQIAGWLEKADETMGMTKMPA